MRYAATVEGRTFIIEVTPEGKVRIQDREHKVDLQSIDTASLYSLLIDNRSYEMLIEEREEGEYHVLLRGELYAVQVEGYFRHRMSQRRRVQARPSGRMTIRAPMPGLVMDVLVGENQEVSTGDVLIILESMKMENEVRAPCDGRVNKVRVHPSDTVEKGQTLVVLTAGA